MSVICHNGYKYLAVNMSVSTEKDVLNAMILEFGGEDVELVFNEIRKCYQVKDS